MRLILRGDERAVLEGIISVMEVELDQIRSAEPEAYRRHAPALGSIAEKVFHRKRVVLSGSELEAVRFLGEYGGWRSLFVHDPHSVAAYDRLIQKVSAASECEKS